MPTTSEGWRPDVRHHRPRARRDPPGGGHQAPGHGCAPGSAGYARQPKARHHGGGGHGGQRRRGAALQRRGMDRGAGRSGHAQPAFPAAHHGSADHRAVHPPHAGGIRSRVIPERGGDAGQPGRRAGPAGRRMVHGGATGVPMARPAPQAPQSLVRGVHPHRRVPGGFGPAGHLLNPDHGPRRRQRPDRHPGSHVPGHGWPGGAGYPIRPAQARGGGQQGQCAAGGTLCLHGHLSAQRGIPLHDLRGAGPGGERAHRGSLSELRRAPGCQHPGGAMRDLPQRRAGPHRRLHP